MDYSLLTSVVIMFVVGILTAACFMSPALYGLAVLGVVVFLLALACFVQDWRKR